MHMEWSRGAVVGRGSFSTVSLAFVRPRIDQQQQQLPPVMAVKSAPLSRSALLQHERSVLSDLHGCPQLVRCFGHDVIPDSAAAGAHSYNLFLEYVSGGTLSDVLRRSGGSLRESLVRLYAYLILRGLRHVHSRGYAHCDVKPQNILVDGSGANVKIADFGLAKKIADDVDESFRAGIRGTPLYMSPESVARSEYGAAADIWSLGCVVAEMATGGPAWNRSDDRDPWELLFRIGFSDELPTIPSELSEKGKDFLRRCFVKDPAKRWTAEMLLQHPFIALQEDPVAAVSVDASMVGDQCSSTESSPRSVLGLSQWLSPKSPSSSMFSSLMESIAPPDSCVSSPADCIRELATAQRPNWSSSSSAGGWIDVRVSDINFKSGEAQETKLDSMLILEQMMSRNRNGVECRPETANEPLKFTGEDVCSTATIELSLPLLSSKHEGQTEYAPDSTKIVDSEVADGCTKSNSSSQTCWLHKALILSLIEEDCKIDSSLNG